MTVIPLIGSSGLLRREHVYYRCAGLLPGYRLLFVPVDDPCDPAFTCTESEFADMLIDGGPGKIGISER